MASEITMVEKARSFPRQELLVHVATKMAGLETPEAKGKAGWIAIAIGLVAAVGELLSGLGEMGVRVPGGAISETGRPHEHETQSSPVGPSRVFSGAEMASALSVEGVMGFGLALVLMGRRQKQRDGEAASIAAAALESATAKAEKDGAARAEAAKEASLMRVAIRVVRALHQRWFHVENSAALHPDYRVTLWLPHPSAASPEKWKCLANSGEDHIPEWPCVQDAARISSAGLVAVTAHQGMGFDVKGLTESETEDYGKLQGFLSDAYITEHEQKMCSWPFATATTRVAARRGGRIECILMVERKSGKPIQPVLLDEHIDDLCGGELDLTTSIWSEVFGGLR